MKSLTNTHNDTQVKQEPVQTDLDCPQQATLFILAQSLFLKVEINPLKSDYSLEGLKLKLQHFGHLMPRVYSLEKTLMLGKTEGKIGGDRG